MEEILRSGASPTALVVANDLMAIGALRICEREKVLIPHDIALMGMDDSEMALCTSPELSSVQMQQEEIGRTAARLLMERISKGRKEKQTVRLQPALSLRASSEGDQKFQPRA
jgi:LacI family transcriptional regulator